jgi:hypothetical protein
MIGVHVIKYECALDAFEKAAQILRLSSNSTTDYQQ